MSCLGSASAFWHETGFISFSVSLATLSPRDQQGFDRRQIEAVKSLFTAGFKFWYSPTCFTASAPFLPRLFLPLIHDYSPMVMLFVGLPTGQLEIDLLTIKRERTRLLLVASGKMHIKVCIKCCIFNSVLKLKSYWGTYSNMCFKANYKSYSLC